MASFMSGALKIAVAATNKLAPASTTRGAVKGEMPPSTAMRGESLSFSHHLEKRAILGTTSGIKDWPEKPGQTDMKRIYSRSLAKGFKISSEVVGFKTMPALQPS